MEQKYFTKMTQISKNNSYELVDNEMATHKMGSRLYVEDE